MSVVICYCYYVAFRRTTGEGAHTICISMPSTPDIMITPAPPMLCNPYLVQVNAFCKLGLLRVISKHKLGSATR